MPLLSTYGDTRRSKRRHAALGLIGWAVLAGLVVMGLAVSYRLGLSQGRTEIARLEGDLATMHELNRVMSERAAHAEQGAEAAITRRAQLEQAYRAEVPAGQLRELVDLAQARLKDGVPFDRLAFLLRAARIERRCEKDLERRRVPVHTAASTSPLGSTGFLDGRITVTAEGMAAPRPEGGGGGASAGEPFDPARPVALRFLRIDGEVAAVEGRLPLTHAVVLGGQELMFAIAATDQAPPGQVEVTMQRCAYP